MKVLGMMKQVRSGAVAASLLLASMTMIGTADAELPAERANSSAVANSRFTTGAVLSASKRQLVEGERYTLTATIKSPNRASKATLQKWYVPAYGDPTWQSVKTSKVRGQRKTTFRAIAVEEDAERYRLLVAYKRVKTVSSPAISVTVWRWIPLSDYAPYYQSEYNMGFGTATINGQAYSGWGPRTYSHTGTWEGRFTPGRHCRSFKGVLGVSDVSADGSSGRISVTADDAIVYESAELSPGMELPVTIAIARPYRIGLQFFDTTPGATTGRDEIEAWPVIGGPALLCTGV